MDDTYKPAWQTDELDEEWIEPSSDPEDLSVSSHGTRSISFTEPLKVQIHSQGEHGQSSRVTTYNLEEPVGTMLIREDAAPVPFLPKTPGKKKGLIKDFFSPMPLETMFEPPSPPVQQEGPYSRLPSGSEPLSAATASGSHRSSTVRNDSKDSKSSIQAPTLDCKFTFAVPLMASSGGLTPGNHPQAQSTPGNYAPASLGHPVSNPPMTDPRLRLFQFQYDTFTRDHLSAMVDSIAVNTPSGDSAMADQSPDTSLGRLSKIPELDGPPDSPRLRSNKRIKLSPASEYYGEGDGAGASITRPKIFAKDYVGESQSLMQKIKQARDFSTVSTVASGQSPANRHEEASVHQAHDVSRQQLDAVRSSSLNVPEQNALPSSAESSTSKRGTYSSLVFRQQAADLMAQIKHDMGGPKRIFSDNTADISHYTTADGKPSSRSPTPDGFQRQSDNTQDHIRRLSIDVRLASTSHPSFIASGTRPRDSLGNQLRQPTAAGQLDRTLSTHLSKLSIREPAHPLTTSESTAHSNPNHNPTLLAPPGGPAYPSSSVRGGGPHEDMNRFVSSSTTSGTTLTGGSAPSLAKHAGPVQITRIGPEDVPPLYRVGKMVFDKVMMKWVKSTQAATATLSDEERREYTSGTDISEDPFKDFESLREDDSNKDQLLVEEDVEAKEQRRYDEEQRLINEALSTIEEAEDQFRADENDMDFHSFSFDEPPTGVVQVMTGIDGSNDFEDATTDSDDDADLFTPIGTAVGERFQDAFDSEDDLPVEVNEGRSIRSPQSTGPVSAISSVTPQQVPSASGATPVPKSALKSTSVTPVSAFKNPVRGAHETPAPRKGHRRSVSFSDGKRDGPIRGLSRNAALEEAVQTSPLSAGFVPSTRSKRIADMMDGFESTDYNDDSPSKTNSSARPHGDELQPIHRRGTNSPARGSPNHRSREKVSRKPLYRSQSHRLSTGSVRAPGNATFLTECSFGVAHDRLVQVITDVQPYDPYWEDLTAIDLSRKNLESVARLQEFLPRLDSLILNSNQLSWLSGVPGTVRTLSVVSNLLTKVVSFHHLLNLENLDISHNDIESLRQLECLRHLRELRADGNRIANVDGLQKMDGLVKLSLIGNQIRELDMTAFRWSRLEMLNISNNRIESIIGLALLPCLAALNADNNCLPELEAEETMPRLRVLRVSGNRLQRLDAGRFPSLRTLYADNNALGTLLKAERLTKLENLSLRNQGGRGLNISLRHVRDVKRLYLSGNNLGAGFIDEPCYNLVYLELAACGLRRLPPALARLAPNLRVLNLNYNFIEDAGPLAGLGRLRKLSVVGGRLKGTRALIRAVQTMPDAEVLDFRMNPCTLGWYLPLLVEDVPGALQPSGGAPARTISGSGATAGPAADASGNQAPWPPHSGNSRSRGHGRGHAGAGSAAGPPAARGGSAGGSAPSARVPSSSSSSSSASAPPAPAASRWQELDAHFRRGLPHDAYAGRLAYRGLVMRACARLAALDGVAVSGRERAKAERVLRGIGEMRRKGRGEREEGKGER